IDLWISPAAVGPAPEGLESTGDPAMNLPWTHAGLPTLSLPSGRSPRGLPLGTQLIGGWQRDEQLLAFAARLEPIMGDG
ncbi:MAG: amidase family protein, partial [Anaerolineales bacterium]